MHKDHAIQNNVCKTHCEMTRKGQSIFLNMKSNFPKFIVINVEHAIKLLELWNKNFVFAVALFLITVD